MKFVKGKPVYSNKSSEQNPEHLDFGESINTDEQIVQDVIDEDMLGMKDMVDSINKNFNVIKGIIRGISDRIEKNEEKLVLYHLEFELLEKKLNEIIDFLNLVKCHKRKNHDTIS